MEQPTTSGYSGRPLYKKLTIKEAYSCLLVSPPDTYMDWLQCPFSLKMEGPPYDFIHIFSNDKEELKEAIHMLFPDMKQDGMIWVSWPKKASKVPSTVTEDEVRNICLPMGLVDCKVCSVSPIWSGLKLMIRKELRKK